MLLGIHLFSTGIFFGATLGLVLFAVPAARALGNGKATRHALARALRIYDPVVIAVLGVMVMTGAYSVTGFKQSLGPEFFRAFGSWLAWKLSFAFFVVMLGTYLAFGIGHRLVRQDEWDEPVDEARLQSMVRRLVSGAWLTLVVTGATVLGATAQGR